MRGNSHLNQTQLLIIPVECVSLTSIRLRLCLVICTLVILTPIFTNTEIISAQSGSPPARLHPGIQFDAENDRVIMFGGGTISGVLGDTWKYEYSLNTWTRLYPPTSPPARSGAAMVYAPTHECMILFGGWSGSTQADDTWIFNCTTDEWEEVSPAVSPSPRMSSNMVYDSTNDLVLLFSGYGAGLERPQDTWCYNISENTWTQLDPETSPTGRYGHCMFYDTENNRTVLFSGNAEDGMNADLWEYDYSTDTWSELSTYPNPLGRKWGSMTYDSDLNRGFLFGGDCNDPEFIADTWILNCSTSDWAELEPASHPERRASPGLAYDSTNHLVVLFGGQGGGFGGDYYPFDDTWVFTDGEWIDMSTIPSGSATTTGGALSIEWIITGVSIPLLIGAFLFMKLKRRNQYSN